MRKVFFKRSGKYLCPLSHDDLCVPVQVLQRGGPYPQVILPQFGGYWIEEPSEETREEEEEDAGDYGYHLEQMNKAARSYRTHFLGRVSVQSTGPPLPHVLHRTLF